MALFKLNRNTCKTKGPTSEQKVAGGRQKVGWGGVCRLPEGKSVQAENSWSMKTVTKKEQQTHHTALTKLSCVVSMLPLYLPLCLPLCLPLYLLLCLPDSLSVCLPFCLFVCFTVFLCSLLVFLSRQWTVTSAESIKTTCFVGDNNYYNYNSSSSNNSYNYNN